METIEIKCPKDTVFPAVPWDAIQENPADFYDVDKFVFPVPLRAPAALGRDIEVLVGFLNSFDLDHPDPFTFYAKSEILKNQKLRAEAADEDDHAGEEIIPSSDWDPRAQTPPTAPTPPPAKEMTPTRTPTPLPVLPPTRGRGGRGRARGTTRGGSTRGRGRGRGSAPRAADVPASTPQVPPPAAASSETRAPRKRKVTDPEVQADGIPGPKDDEPRTKRHRGAINYKGMQ